jgi:hypothetical protein
VIRLPFLWFVSLHPKKQGIKASKEMNILKAKKMTPCKKENETGVRPRFFNDLIERYYVKSQIQGCWSI